MFPSSSCGVCYSTDEEPAFRHLLMWRLFYKSERQGGWSAMCACILDLLFLVSFMLRLFFKIKIREVTAKGLKILHAMSSWQWYSWRKLKDSFVLHESLGFLQLKSDTVTCPALERYGRDIESIGITLATALILFRSKESTLYFGQLERYQLWHFYVFFFPVHVSFSSPSKHGLAQGRRGCLIFCHDFSFQSVRQ